MANVLTSGGPSSDELAEWLILLTAAEELRGAPLLSFYEFIMGEEITSYSHLYTLFIEWQGPLPEHNIW